jgi:NADH:ubiquinone oxidoreductase subunit E
MEKKQEKKLGAILKKFNSGDETVISVLQDIQEEFGYVPEEAVSWFAEKTNVPASKFFGIVTFYAQFHLNPRGKNIITACCGTVCHVKDADRIISRLKDELSLKGEQDTTKDGMFTLETVNCVGACSIAPIVIVNDKVHGKMNPDKAVKCLKVTGKKSE